VPAVPFRHVVMFRWADHVGADHVDRVRDAFDALPAQVPQIRRYVHGADAGFAEGNFDYVVVADFDRVDDWRTYRDHPAHLLLIEELIKGHVAERAAVQYHTGPERGAPAMPAAAGAVPDDPGDTPDDFDDDELMARARRAAMADMEALLAEPD
jgi:hypothetical protein